MSDELLLEAAHFGAEAAPCGAPLVQATLPATVPASASAMVSAERPLRPLPEQVEQLERQAIAQALRQTAGNRMAAARLLQISRASLYERLARWPELG